MKKLALWKICNQNNECFETLQTFIIENKGECNNDIISEISKHLVKLKERFEFYFHEEMNAFNRKDWLQTLFSLL